MGHGMHYGATKPVRVVNDCPCSNDSQNDQYDHDPVLDLVGIL